MKCQSFKSICFIVLPLLFVACNTGPSLKHSTRTGNIADIKITERLNPQMLEVKRGDEVRWINSRGESVDIVFVDSLQGRLSCENGFFNGGVTGMLSKNATNTNVTTIGPDKYASLCFTTPGTYVYNARMEASVPGSETNLKGTVSVK